MTALALYSFAFRAKLNGRATTGTVQATNSTQAIAKVKQMNELYSGISVRVAKARKTVKSCACEVET